jgi:uncharacterized membrane protein YidH (DUF202 family)
VNHQRDERRDGPRRDQRDEQCGGRLDPGLQPERTRLAWRRTTLAVTVAAVLATRTALHGGPSAAGVLACTLCVVLSLGFLNLAQRRIRALATPRPRALGPRQVTLAALCTAALALCGAALVF